MSYAEANEQEIHYIHKYDTCYNGYNSTLGGDHAFPPEFPVGENHHRANITTYTFYHKSGKKFEGTTFALREHLQRLSTPNRLGINNLVSGVTNSWQGWALHVWPTKKVEYRRCKVIAKFVSKCIGQKSSTKIPKTLTPLEVLVRKANQPPKRGSKEWLDNYRKNSTGSNNAMYGTKRPQHVKDAVSKRRRSEADQTLRNWVNTITNTVEYQIKTIDLRDKYPNLLISHLKRVSDGHAIKHKGWKLHVEKSYQRRI